MYDKGKKDRDYMESRQDFGDRGKKKDKETDSDINEIIKKIESSQSLKDLVVEEIAKEEGYAERIAKSKSFKNLKTTQLRNLFDEIKENERRLNEKGWNAIEADFYMLRPNLAYAKARDLIPEDFFNLMNACMKQVDKGNENEKKENYKRFVQFLEAIVAYHKYHWG
ncbi:MAG TPA: type III-A CRISPR-associated protein Csm2 [Halobacteria archaeon]|jgi:CRISPR-associated protein Csm2|nr:type III-A CRISPR-associated protein Csm2 [Halobacteria archaeon]